MTNSCQLVIQEQSQMALEVGNHQIKAIRQGTALIPRVAVEEGAGLEMPSGEGKEELEPCRRKDW